MGGFILYQNNINLEKNAIIDTFQKQGLVAYKSFNISNYSIWIFKKVLISNQNYFILNRDNAIFSTGTLIYRSLNPNNSIKRLLQDIISDNIDEEKIIGHFACILLIEGNVKLFIDKGGTYSIYFNKEKTVFSSSFLAVSLGLIEGLTINKNALTEVLLTGGLIGPETLFNEILRLEPGQVSNDFRPKLIKLKLPEYYLDSKKDRSTLITEQLDRLDNYFGAIEKLSNQYGSLIGLTGGFDSRLLMCFAERHFNKVNYFSYGRIFKNIELEVSEKLASVVNKELNITKFTSPLQMTENEAANTLDKAFYHYDGHIRTQSYWHEEYNTLDYTKLLYSSNFVGFHGVGGEQYRNYERMIKPYWNFNSWLRQEVVFRYSANIFFNKTNEKLFINYFKAKIEKKLNIKAPRFIDHLFVKRYYNEIHNISNRTTRSTIENKAVYFLSPFADPLISYKAYEIIPKLGSSLEFQSLMIKKINPALASIDSNYGFNFFDGESLSSCMKGYLKELVPRRLFFRIYHHTKKTKNDDFYNNYKNKFSFVREAENNIKKLNLDIDVDKLKLIKDTGWLLIATGYFLKKFHHKLK